MSSYRSTELRSTRMSRIKLSFDADFLSNLPEEILLQILIKLPAEALIQLMSVSKQFKSLIIRNLQFIEAHLSSNVENVPKPYLLSFCYEFSSYRGVFVSSSPNYSFSNSIEVPFQLPQYSSQHPHLIGNSARGVVCLASKATHSLILWNPLARKFRMVPDKLTYSNLHTVYGFGFDHVNSDFKIVQLSYDPTRNTKHVLVYEVKSRRWKSVATNDVPCYVTKYDNCVHVNGTVYWPAFKTSPPVWRACIMGFDLVNEVFKAVELPSSKYSRLSNTLLRSSSDGKSLAFFGGSYDSYHCKSWHVWYFSSKDSIWEKRYDISVIADSFRPLGILDDDSGAIIAEFLISRTIGVVNGVKKGAARSAATKVNHRSLADISSEFVITSYTPSLAFLLE